MRKILSCAMCAAVLLSAAVFPSCSPEPAPPSGYTIAAEYFPSEHKLTGDMTVRFSNETELVFDELKFQLWPNAFREGAKYAPVSSLYLSAYYRGMSYGEIDITGLSGAKSFSGGGEDANILSVALNEPLGKGETATVSLSFEVELAEVNHRLGVTRGSVNLANFYPVLCALGEEGFEEYVYSYNGDPFVSACADYDVTLTVPENYTVISGFPAEETAADGKKQCHVVAENVRDIAFVLGTQYNCITSDANGVEVAYYYYKDPSPETALAVAAQSLSYFGETFGAYAYPRYVVAETDFAYGGMEYPALSWIATGTRPSEKAAVIAHETAHQWWYAMVGSNQFEHAWQDEGLAEFSAALFLGAHPDYGTTYAEAVAASESSYRAFFSVYSQVNGGADTTMDRPLTAFSGEYEYRNIAYDKGVILFDRVKEVAGEKRFYAALKRYKETYEGKLASPDDLIDCFRRAGANVAGLFTSFTDGLCVI